MNYTPFDFAGIFNTLNCEVHRETVMAATWDIVKRANEERKAKN